MTAKETHGSEYPTLNQPARTTAVSCAILPSAPLPPRKILVFFWPGQEVLTSLERKVDLRAICTTRQSLGCIYQAFVPPPLDGVPRRTCVAIDIRREWRSATANEQSD